MVSPEGECSQISKKEVPRMAELVVLNPVADTKTEKFELASRLTDLSGKTIGLFWNAKSWRRCPA